MAKNASIPSALELDKALLPWLGRISKLMIVYMKQKFDQHGIDLTPKQWVALKHLVEEDGREQNHLALITERDKTSLTRLISNMESRGLVKRTPSAQDKRVNLLHITAKGRRVFDKTLPLVTESIREIQAGVSDDEMRNTLQALHKVHENVKELLHKNSGSL